MAGRGRIKIKKQPKKKQGKKLRRSLLQALDLPVEVDGSIPRLTIVGKFDLLLENHTGVLHCGKEQIRLTTSGGVVMVEGKALVLLELANGRAYVKGTIEGVKFV